MINITCNQYKWYDMAIVVVLSRQMSSWNYLVVEPSQLGSLKGLSGTKDTRIILVRPLTVKVKAYVQLRWYYLGFQWPGSLIAMPGYRSVVSLSHKMQAPNKCFTLSLCDSNSCKSNSWWDDHDTTMEIKLSSRWRWRSGWCFGDGDQRHKMMIAISCHIFCLHVMFILYASYSALFDGSIIRWSLT